MCDSLSHSKLENLNMNILIFFRTNYPSLFRTDVVTMSYSIQATTRMTGFVTVDRDTFTIRHPVHAIAPSDKDPAHANRICICLKDSTFHNVKLTRAIWTELYRSTVVVMSLACPVHVNTLSCPT